LQLQQAAAAAIKLKTSAARLAQLLQPSLSLPIIGCNLKQNANEECNSCACLAGHGLVSSFIVSFIACFLVVVIPP